MSLNLGHTPGHTPGYTLGYSPGYTDGYIITVSYAILSDHMSTFTIILVRATCVVGEPLKIYVAPYQNTGSIKVYYASDAATLNGDLSNYNCVQDTLTGDEYQRLDLPQNVDSAVGDCQPANVSSFLMY